MLVERRTPTEKALGWFLVAAAAEFWVLAATGVILIFFYRPSPAQAWQEEVHGPPVAPRLIEAVRFVHRRTAHAMVVTVLALAVTGVMLFADRSLRTRRHRVTAASAVGIAVFGLFASFTGYLRPWDQLSLWAVTVGTDMMGFMPIIGHSSPVRFVLIGGSEISLGAFRAWFYLHVLAAPAVVLALGIVAARRFRGGQREQSVPPR